MKFKYQTIWLVLLPLLLLSYGCGENGLFGGGDEPVPRGEQCDNGLGFCITGASCVNGYCECPDTNLQIRPGFCYQRVAPAMFVTYDDHPEWVDTTIIAINIEPFDVDWSGVGEFGIQLSGQTLQFNREFSGGTVGRIFPPENLELGADSIWITPIRLASRASNGQAYFNDRDWSCRKVFQGRFINRDTIVGKLHFIGCGGPRETPMPDEVANPTHEMTWVRLE